MRRAHLRVLAAAFVVLSVAASGIAHEQATGVVKERMDAMKSMAKSMKAINERLKEKRNLDSIKSHARLIQQAAGKMPALFPRGTEVHPSEAKAAIWQNWPDFEAKARTLVLESGKLAEADVLDAKALAVRARQVSDSCGNCHELYRAKHQHHKHH
jgi:cytochrome c556